MGVVEAVTGDRARLVFADPPVLPLPDGVLAYPKEVSLGRRPIVVTPANHPSRSAVVEIFRRSPMVRVAEGDEVAGALATIALGDDGAKLLDVQDQPL